jgi:CelD/BcsL family acetyltransferase involved in cellulose biosynthesis
MSHAATAQVEDRSFAAPALQVRALTAYSDFLALEPGWTDLVRRAAIEHPFLEHAWLRTWWECFGGESSLYILVVTSAGRLTAVAPLMLTNIRMWGLSLRRLSFLYNSHVPRAGFIVAERADEVYEAIWKQLREKREWDLIQLCQLVTGSSTFHALRSLAGRDLWPADVWCSGASPYVPLDGGWEAYYRTLPAKHRSNLRNRLGRLNKAGSVEFETVDGGDQLPASLSEGLRLEAAAWKGDAGTAILNDPNVTRFYALLSGRAAERGWLRLNFLRAGTEAVAFDYSLEYRNRMFLLKLGYDPEFSPYSPSNLLLFLSLRGAFDRGLDEYDFLGEEAEWKRCWASCTRPNNWLYIFRPSLKGRLLHFVKFRLIPWLKRRRLGSRIPPSAPPSAKLA